MCSGPTAQRGTPGFAGRPLPQPLCFKEKMIRRTILTLMAIFVMLLNGCDSFPRVMYKVGDIDSYPRKSDLNLLCHDIELIGNEFGLSKQKAKREATVCYFTEALYFTLTVGVRYFGDNVVVDVEAVNRDREYKILQERIETLLSNKYPDYIVVKSLLSR